MIAIGRYPAVGLAEARERHQAARKLVELGKSPVVVKRQAKHAARLGASNTVQAIGDAWYAELAPHKSEAWRKQARSWLDTKIYPSMGSSPISEVEPADVLALCEGIAATRPKTGEYIRLTLSRIFSYAIRNLRAKHNPAREVQGAIVVPPAEHHKPLSAKQIPVFIEALDRYPGRLPTKLAAKLLLLTMVRKRELINATWDELDLKEGLWSIPPDRMKRREPHVVPLSTQALAAFKELKPMASGSRYVFPNLGRLDKPMGASSLNVAFERMKLAVTPHAARNREHRTERVRRLSARGNRAPTLAHRAQSDPGQLQPGRISFGAARYVAMMGEFHRQAGGYRRPSQTLCFYLTLCVGNEMGVTAIDLACAPMVPFFRPVRSN